MQACNNQDIKQLRKKYSLLVMKTHIFVSLLEICYNRKDMLKVKALPHTIKLLERSITTDHYD
jgi:hypothetical protein